MGRGSIYLRSDNGPEFVARAMLTWMAEQGIETALINPGKPWQNGVAESFNGKFRDECLSLEWFHSRAEAKVVIEAWRRHYNEVRPHSSLGCLTAGAVAALSSSQLPLSQGAGSLRLTGGYVPRPVAAPPVNGQTKEETPVFST